MEYKHFSHVHGLAYHQMPHGTEIQCSGCKFPATGNIYACWQCRYFLHEQCFQATRSLKHPSHTIHPLTLIPYPTYPSNSFYCNTCNLLGSGFSYCCSECDFDLHVHCAFTPNPTPPPLPQNSSPVSYPSFPDTGYGGTQNFSPHQPAAGHHFHDNFPPNYHGSVQHNAPMNPLPNSPTIPNSYQEPFQQSANSNPPPVSTASLPTGYAGSFQNIPAASGQVKPPPVSPPMPQASAPIRISLLSNPLKVKEVKHFSHPHGLVLNEIKETTAPKVCSGCEDDLTTGSVYSCIDPQCNFNLHKSCFELPLEIHHKSHLDHPLKLLAKPPSNYTDNQFACNACLQCGAAFVYNCDKCSFDLHVECVSLPESIIRPDHNHALKLFYSNPVPKAEDQEQESRFICDVCQKQVHEVAWIYYCHECDFGTHLECAAYEVQPAQKTEEELVLEAELKLAMLNLLINGGIGPAGVRET